MNNFFVKKTNSILNYSQIWMKYSFLNRNDY
nr:MAG TPA: hypothetical protein [Bacteriophage sp.]